MLRPGEYDHSDADPLRCWNDAFPAQQSVNSGRVGQAHVTVGVHGTQYTPGVFLHGRR